MRCRQAAAAVVASAFLVPAGLTAAWADARQPVRSIGPEGPVTPVDRRFGLAHNSPMVVADPTDDRFVAIATRLDNPDFGCALHLSGDSGRTWAPAFPIERLPAGAEKCYAPEVAFDDSGTLYYLFVGLAGQGNNPMGAFLVVSTDRGQTFSTPRKVLDGERYMVRLVIDRTLGGAGRLHLVWLQTTLDSPLGGLPAPPNPIMSAYSDDGGRTFSQPVQVSDPARQRVVAPAVALGADGAVHVLYYDLQSDARDYQGLEGPVWDGKWSLVVSSSSDRGRTFGPGVLVDDGLVPTERVMLIYTMAPPSLAADGKGHLYAAWHDGRNGDWDVFLRRSSDGGRHWAAARRLNDDATASGAHQYMPRLAVAPSGRVDAVFYDRRRDPRNERNDLYYTTSSDDGRSFAPNVRVTSESSTASVGARYSIPSAKGQFERGSRIGLLAGPGVAVAAWTEARNAEPEEGTQEVWSARIGVDEGGGRSVWPLVALAAIGTFLGVATTVLVTRRRSAPQAPSPSIPSSTDKDAENI